MRTPLLKFTGGVLNKKLWGRYDSELYFSSAEELYNWDIMPEGPLSYRFGFEQITSFSSGNIRIFPFIASPEHFFLVVMRGTTLSVFYENGTSTAGDPVWTEIEFSGVTLPYASQTALREIQNAQTAGAMYFVHRSAPVMVLTWEGGTTFSWSEIEVTGNSVDEDGNAIDLPFQSTDNYPSAIAVLSGRLVLGGTNNEPQKVWMSQPFDYGNFTYFETVEVTYTQLKDESEWADPEYPETEEVTTEKNIIGDGDAIIFEINSDENEAIVGMATNTDLMISTTTGEWVSPSDITANDVICKLYTRHGGIRVQPFKVGNGVIFASSKKQLKQFVWNTDSGTFLGNDIGRQGGLLDDGIIELDYAQHPNTKVFALLDSGEIAVLINEPIYQVMAWSKIKIANQEIKSLAILPGDDGDDRILAIVTDGITDTLVISSTEEYIDMALHTEAGASEINITDNMLSNGYVVKVIHADESYEIVDVSAGNTIDPADYETGSKFVAGYAIEALYQSPPIPGVVTKNGQSETDASSIRSISPKMSFYLIDTKSLEVSEDGETYYSIFSESELDVDTVVNGIQTVPFSAQRTRDAKIFLRQNKPEPSCVAAIYAGVIT